MDEVTRLVSVEPYGKYKAKIDFKIDKEKIAKSKLILVTATTPNKSGSGKTTTSVALTQGLQKLGKKAIFKVVGKFIKEINDQLQEKNVAINVDETVVEWLGEKGFDDKMGARPIHRTIEQELKKPISKEILFGALNQGGEVFVTIKDGKLDFQYQSKQGDVSGSKVGAEQTN